MGSSLGPDLANIFVSDYDYLLFQTTSKPKMCYCYMDDTFVVQYLATKMSAMFSYTASTRFTLLFALLLKKILTWFSLFRTC